MDAMRATYLGEHGADAAAEAQGFSGVAHDFARVAALSVPAMLGSWLFPLVFWYCSALQANVAMLCAGSATAFALGIANHFSPLWKKRSTIGLAAIAVASCVLILAVPSAREGAFSFANAAISGYDDAFASYVPLVASGNVGANSIVFGLLVGVLSGLVSWRLSKSHLNGVLVLATALLGGISIRIDLGYGGIAVALGVAVWLTACRFSQLKHASFSASVLLTIAVVVLVLCSAIFAIRYVVYPPSSSIEGAKGSIEQAIDELRYGDDSLPEGDMLAASSMNEGDDDCLEIEFDRLPQNELLLRGFVGSDFSEASWSPLGHTAYEGQWYGMASWLLSQDFVPAFQRASFDDAVAAVRQSSVESVNAQVSNLRADARYLYVPYSVRSVSGASRLDLDGSLINEGLGVRSYSMSVDDVSASDAIADASFLQGSSSTYASAESVFSAFAHDNYLGISDEEREAVTELIFNPETWDSSAAQGDYAVISRVRTMLETLASTTKNVSQPASDEPFCQWFLGQEHKGNSAYFATAATLAFRSQGIPARYVEGYRIGQSELSQAASGDGTVKVGAAQAHAWCEVYLEGAGWTPVEVTPGFYKQTLQVDSLIDVGEAYSNGNEDTAADGESVAGAYEEKELQESASSVAPLYIVAIIVAALLLAAVCAIVAAFVQRAIRIALRNSSMASEDQSVCIPAMYRHLSSIMREGCEEFEADRPLDCATSFERSFPGIDSMEYARAIELYQAHAFGMRELRPNELRTLRRFNERLHAALAQPKGLAGAAIRRFVKAL